MEGKYYYYKNIFILLLFEITLNTENGKMTKMFKTLFYWGVETVGVYLSCIKIVEFNNIIMQSYF